MAKASAHFVDCSHRISSDATGDTTYSSNNYTHSWNEYKDYVIYVWSRSASASQVFFIIEKLTDNDDGTFTSVATNSQGTNPSYDVGFDGTYVYSVRDDFLDKLDLDLQMVTSWQTNGSKEMTGLDPYICTANPDTGMVIVSVGATTVYLLDSDGNEIWNIALSHVRSACFTESGDILVSRFTNTGPRGYKLSVTNGATLATYAEGCAGDYMAYIAENPVTNEVIMVGNYNDDKDGVYAWPASGGGIADISWSNEIIGGIVRPQSVHCTLDGNVYVCGPLATNPAGNVHKYTSAGVYVTSYTIGSGYAFSLAERSADTIFVGGQRGENEDGHNNTMNVLDGDFSYYGGYDHGANQYGSNTVRAFAFPVIEISTAPEVTGTQDRTIWYPPDTTDYSHLEGETVQCLGDGIYQGEEEVVSGDISLDDNTTVNHVGLKITSKVQPMKPDGVSEVKRISKIIPDVYESLDGEYGENLDDMYAMTLRDSDDIMDRDGDLYSGYVELPFKGRYDRHGDIWITQDIPLPFRLLGIGVNLSKEAI